MPPIGTPSPFRLPSQRPRSASARGAGLAFRSPASSSAGRQFASTPRFVLPGSTPSRFSRDEIYSSDEEEPSSPVARPRRELGSNTAPSSSRQKDAIEDSEEEDANPSNSPGSGAQHDVPDSHPCDGERDLVAEFDDIFPPTPNRVKRRRVSADPEVFSSYRRRSHLDPIHSSPSEPPSPSEARNGSPPPSALPRATAPIATPAPRLSLSATTETSRPGISIAAKTPFRAPPRSLFSASQSVSRPSPQIRFGSSTPAPQSPRQRKRPAFVLPRSPSPSYQTDDHSIPTPFSPSSRSLRRGRPRSNTPSYVPGGMAAQVRSWILETAATGEHNRRTMSNSAQTHISSEQKKFLLTAEVITSSQGTLASGPFTLVKGHSAEIQPLQPSQYSSSQDRNLLLVGPPQSKSTGVGPSTASEQAPKLSKNNVVGVHHGLLWEVELGFEDMVRGLDSRPGEATAAQNKEKWLVGLEWEILR
ncbi:hypothetical protein DTO063F5_846 [Paecilomyces variotii]|nr:hypothetical protein DTO063F5_846 [Paecilomyces variotii]KAJ9404575.1 hypothetical protein DTO045G8_7648 [Paecilomyces variotii]